MASVMAIVSKAVFEKAARGVAVGAVWGCDRYVSQNKALAPLAEGGDLYLVTVRPPETLWLVAVLRAPRAVEGEWRAAANTVAVRVIDAVKSALRFTSGSGIAAKPGALGMSLQTPRVLTAGDVALLEQAAGHGPAATGKGVAPAVAASLAEAPPPKKPRAPPATPAPMRAPASDGEAMPELAATLAHLAADEPGAALLQALAAWRRLRAPLLADLVVAIGQRVDAAMTPVSGNKAEAQQRWLDLAAQRRAVDLGRLLAPLADASLPAIRQRFELLGAFAPDPRLAAPMLAIPPEYSYEAGPCFSMAFDVAAQSGDPRARALLDAMLGAPLTPERGQSPAWREYLAKHARRAAKVRDALPSEVPLPPAVAAQAKACLAANLRAGAPPSEADLLAQISRGARGDGLVEDLLAAVLRHPERDEPRQVYADALLERGDPRGEFIALQLARAQRGGEPGARERLLIKRHGREWIAPLDAAVRADSVRFARGFLDAGAVAWKTSEQRRTLGKSPLWATVRELDCPDQDFLMRPELRSLERATLSPRSLAQLATRSAPLPLAAVIGALEMRYGIRMRRGAPVGRARDWGAALDVGALVNLRALQLTDRSADPDDDSRDIELTPAWLAWLLDSRLGRQLRQLELHAGRGHVALAPWIDWLRARPAGLALRASFSNGNTASGSTNILATVDLARRDASVDVTLSLNNEMVDIRYLSIGRQIADALAGLPSPHAPRLVVRYTGSKKRATPGFPAVAAQLAKAFAAVELE